MEGELQIVLRRSRLKRRVGYRMLLLIDGGIVDETAHVLLAGLIWFGVLVDFTQMHKVASGIFHSC